MVVTLRILLVLLRWIGALLHKVGLLCGGSRKLLRVRPRARAFVIALFLTTVLLQLRLVSVVANLADRAKLL